MLLGRAFFLTHLLTYLLTLLRLRSKLNFKKIDLDEEVAAYE